MKNINIYICSTFKMKHHQYLALSLICRERASGYYATYPFALAQTLIEFPYLLLQTILYATIT